MERHVGWDMCGVGHVWRGGTGVVGGDLCVGLGWRMWHVCGVGLVRDTGKHGLGDVGNVGLETWEIVCLGGVESCGVRSRGEVWA